IDPIGFGPPLDRRLGRPLPRGSAAEPRDWPVPSQRPRRIDSRMGHGYASLLDLSVRWIVAAAILPTLLRWALVAGPVVGGSSRILLGTYECKNTLALGGFPLIPSMNTLPEVLDPQP